MDEALAHSPNDADKGWEATLTLSWIAGALLTQVPFQLRFKFGNGSLGLNLLIGTGVVIAGVLLTVGLTRLLKQSVSHSSRARRWQILTSLAQGVSIGLFVVALWQGEMGAVYKFGVLLLSLWAMAAITQMIHCSRRTPFHKWTGMQRMRHLWRFNGLYWSLLFLLFLGRDLWNLGTIEDRSATVTALLVAGRLLTLGTLALAFVIVTQALYNLFPRALRWVVIVAVSILPLLIIADFLTELYWQRPLLNILNTFTLDGDFDLREELEAAGIQSPPTVFVAILLAIIGLAAAIYAGLFRLSDRFGFRTHSVRVLRVAGCLWLATVAQQALSMMIYSKELWQGEHAAFKVHLGVLEPERGLETIAVTFREPLPPDQAEALLKSPMPPLERKPDIYIVMIESWRSDSITPEIAPFLHQFREQECQTFQRTFAGSNCTPASWFTLFHSRLAIHWKEAVAQRNTPQGMPGAYPIRLLRQLGYKCSVRAVCDLGYKELGYLHYGTGHPLAETFTDTLDLPRGLSIPAREKIVMQALKDQILRSEPGGFLHFLSLDSPHYGYYWPERDFIPIHTDCQENINYAVPRPSPEQVREVVKRYENAVNWVDHQLREFVAYLKQHDRYEDAIIVITGDHGEEFQEDRSWFHCSKLNRPQIEVPIMIKWPSWLQAPPAQAQASHLDVMPSILDALALPERFYEKLSGRSLLREHPGETVLSTLWTGMSDISFSFIKDGRKAKFASPKPWEGRVPKELYFIGYTDLDDQPLAPSDDASHVTSLRKHFPSSIGRFFHEFGADQME